MSLTDTEILEQGDAVADDNSSGAQASVNATAQTCPHPAITISVFFDGTFNNAFNVSDARDDDGAEHATPSYTGSYTNVRRLWSLHKDGGDNIPNDCGDPDTAFAAIYIDGIGTDAGQPDDKIGGGATAGGDFGIAAKLDEASVEMRSALQQYGAIEDYREITVNCFGFSRGAATARVFCNMLAESGMPNLTIKFLGLFDSVGSIGVPGNNTQRELGDEVLDAYCNTVGYFNPACEYREEGPTYDLNVRASTAETVFQICAFDEFRLFYPVSSILPGHGTEVWMAGCHGDIGGAEADDVVREVYTTRPGFLERRGWFDNATTEVVGIPNAPRPTYNQTVKMVQPNIGTASLHAMHFHAWRAGVPLKPLEELPTRYAKPMSPVLSQAASVMEAGVSVPENLMRPIRARYVHRSFGALIGADTRMFFGRRRSYPNQG